MWISFDLIRHLFVLIGRIAVLCYKVLLSEVVESFGLKSGSDAVHSCLKMPRYGLTVTDASVDSTSITISRDILSEQDGIAQMLNLVPAGKR